MRKFPSLGWMSRFRLTVVKPEWYEESSIKISDDVKLYIKTRLKPFTDGLYQKANYQMEKYYILQIIIIGVAALIPIINVIDTPDEALTRLISAILGSIIVAVSGLIQLVKLRESGIVFRIITSRLQREYHTYILASDDYAISNDQRQRDRLFIHNEESLIMNATTEYYDLFRDSKKDLNQGLASRFSDTSYSHPGLTDVKRHEDK